MGRKVVSLRLDEELLEWADSYAASRGVSRTDLLETGLRSFREDCVRGVPEIRRVAREQSSVRSGPDVGVGDCPERGEGLGHVWGSGDRRPCRFCGAPGRGSRSAAGEVLEPGHFERATAERAELFARLRAPESAFGGAKKK